MFKKGGPTCLYGFMVHYGLGKCVLSSVLAGDTEPVLLQLLCDGCLTVYSRLQAGKVTLWQIWKYFRKDAVANLKNNKNVR